VQLQLPFYPVTVLLVFIRFAALAGMTAVFGRTLVPVRIRLAVAMAFSWFTLSCLPAEWELHCEGLNQVIPLTVAISGEIMLGMAMGLICDLFFAVLSITSMIFARESALMMATMLDPTSEEDSVIFSTLFSLLFTVLIFLWGGHLFLVKLVVESFRVLPPGFFWFRQELLEMYVHAGGDMFRWGLRFALPVMAGSMLITVSMGLIARMAPEFNVLILGLPFRLFMGLGILCLFLLYGYDPLYKVFESMLLHVKYLWAGGV